MPKFALIEKYRQMSTDDKESLFFVCLIWGIDMLYYLKGVVLRLPILNMTAEYFVPIFTILSIIVCFSVIRIRFKAYDYWFFFSCILVFFLHYVLFPDNNRYQEEIAGLFIFNVLPYYFVGLTVDIDKHIDFLEVISLIYIVLGVTYTAMTFSSSGSMQDNEEIESMGKAYAILPHCLLLILSMFRRVRIWNTLGMGLAVFYLFGTGNRGSILVTIFFVVMCFLFFGGYRHKFIIRVIGGVIIIFSYIYIEEIASYIADGLVQLGFSARAFNFILDGEYVSDSNGRDDILNVLVPRIFTGGLFGYGICGDRALSGIYAHNLAVELIISFGPFLGILLLVIILFIVLRDFASSVSMEAKAFLLLLFGYGFVALFISNSFLMHAAFFMLLGYAVNIHRISNKNYIS